METSPFDPGELIGRYRVEGLLAEGGMGAVYVATHVRLARRAAIKVLHAHVADARTRARLFEEARILHALAHPGLARLYEIGLLPGGRPWIAMELLEGETLGDRVARRGALPVREAIEIVLEIADVLAAAHAIGILHRDIKPDNVMLIAGGVPYLKMIDWGYARGARSPRLTEMGTTAGTPAYMSPEQVQGNPLGPSSDVYSLGVVAYELVTGAPPFEGRSAAETAIQHLSLAPRPCTSIRPDLPRALEAVIQRMLAKPPDARPSIAELRDRLAAIDVDGTPAPLRMRWTPPYGTAAAELGDCDGANTPREFGARAADSSDMLPGLCHRERS
jgi:eukaryotic-like serine/threonine-protein kinase